MSLRKIGEELGLARNTVRKYVRRPPEPPLPRPRLLGASQLDPYEDDLLERWSQSERNVARLYREIRERGYPRCATTVRTYVAHLRSTTGNGSPPQSRKERAQAISPCALRWLLTRKPEDFEKARSSQMRSAAGLLTRSASCVCPPPSLCEDVRGRKHEELRSWMEQAISSGILELKSFVAGVERNYDAVHAALRLPWNQGITKGKVNKLKTL